MQEVLFVFAILLLLALDELLGAELQLVGRAAEDVQGFAAFPGQQPCQLALLLACRERQLEPFGLPRQRL